MNVVHINADLIEIDGVVRVERGPKTVTAIATAELLDNSATAAHYQEGAADAIGKPIAVGEEMTYHDWLGEWSFHLYQLDNDGVWQKVDSFESVADAVAHGVTLIPPEAAT